MMSGAGVKGKQIDYKGAHMRTLFRVMEMIYVVVIVLLYTSVMLTIGEFCCILIIS